MGGEVTGGDGMGGDGLGVVRTHSVLVERMREP
jgi:hypothetical protein